MSAVAEARQAPRKIHCDLDDWDFDPQYTGGACPICGWAPEGALKPKPAWQVRLEALPWDLIFLVVLAVVLIVLGVIVGINAKISLLPKGY
jgi:hypothetical protein